MKKLLILITIIIGLSACKDPGVGPGDGKPVSDAGIIKFESPAVGQKSVYVHFLAKGYWDTPSPINYTKDTITWEIVKQIDQNTFLIQETLKGLFFQNYPQSQQYTLVKNGGKILIFGDNGQTSPLLGNKDSVLLSLNNGVVIAYKDWRIGDNFSSNEFRGYIRNYLGLGNEYDRLDIFADLTPMTYDGAGLVYIYNGKYGLVRSYFINPWIGEVNGFDLVVKPTDDKDNPFELEGTKWRLKNVYYKDGTVKEIGELAKGSNNPRAAENFKIFFMKNNEVLGMAGCKNFKGEYKAQESSLTMNITPDITTVYCEFGEEYVASLNKSISYRVDDNRMTIKVDNNDIVALEFENMNDKPDANPLIDTKWRLRALQTANGLIVPIEEILKLKPNETNFGVFSLNFNGSGQISGFSGCNSFSGKYEAEDSEIDIEVGFTTKVLCKFSTEYQELLGETGKYTITGNRLLLYVDGNHYQSLVFEKSN